MLLGLQGERVGFVFALAQGYLHRTFFFQKRFLFSKMPHLRAPALFSDQGPSRVACLFLSGLPFFHLRFGLAPFVFSFGPVISWSGDAWPSSPLVRCLTTRHASILICPPPAWPYRASKDLMPFQANS